ncbi:response regulator [Xinfangfangia pollutisoli]|uniref:response regulator n=1 Tax=Xinfangfangia pollutisoli TaxID=2865960 RepID=UPI001CD4C685|nr:response regulator [Xinfangfangia pollutisoli]
MRILAVDDDPVFLMLLEHVLGAIGYADLVSVNSGSEALARLRDPRQKFDCLLLDIEMPGMTGIELCRRVRAMQNYHTTPIVMITAMKSLEHVEHAFRAGANDYVHKPIDELEMKTRLRMVGDLIDERRRRASVETRLSSDFGLPVVNVTFDEPVTITEAGSVISALALENYALTLGRLRLMGQGVLAFKVANAESIYCATDGVGYIDTMANVASAIDGALKAHNHLIAFAGQGEFVAMVAQRADFDTDLVQDEIELALDRYAQLYKALGIPLPVVRVGEIQHAGLFTRTAVPQLFADARQSARKLAFTH